MAQLISCVSSNIMTPNMASVFMKAPVKSSQKLDFESVEKNPTGLTTEI